MDYNKLKTFVIVAEHRSVTKAASLILRTQSAITQQIRLLEEELGFTLFERKHGRIFLTREGQMLFDSARQTFGKLDDKVIRIKNDLRSIEGRLSVGVIEDFGSSCFGDLITNFKKTYPLIRFDIRSGTDEFIEQALIENKVDIGLLVTFKDKSFFDTAPLRVDEHILVTSDSYWRKKGPFVSYNEVVNAELVDRGEDYPCIGVWLEKNKPQLCGRLQKRRPDVIAEGHIGVKSIIVSGYGLGIVPRYLVEKELQEKSVIPVMPNSKPLRAGIDVALRKKRSDRLVVDLFWSFLSQQHKT